MSKFILKNPGKQEKTIGILSKSHLFKKSGNHKQLKKMNKTFQDMNIGIKIIKKIQTEGVLEIKV